MKNHRKQSGFAHLGLLLLVGAVALVVAVAAWRVSQSSDDPVATNNESSQEASGEFAIAADGELFGEETVTEESVLTEVQAEAQDEGTETAEEAGDEDELVAEAYNYSARIATDWRTYNVWACRTSSRVNMKFVNASSSTKTLYTGFKNSKTYGGYSTRVISSKIPPKTIKWKYRTIRSGDTHMWIDVYSPNSTRDVRLSTLPRC